MWVIKWFQDRQELEVAMRFKNLCFQYSQNRVPGLKLFAPSLEIGVVIDN